MANSNNKHERTAFVAKKNESKVAKALRTQKIIYGIFAGVIALVLIFVGLGIGSWYKNDYKPMKATVISVGDRDFSGAYYVDMLSFMSAQYPMYASLFTGYATYYTEVSELVYLEATKLGYQPDVNAINSNLVANGYADREAVYDLYRASYLQNQMLSDYFMPQVADSGEFRDIYAIMCDDEDSANKAMNDIKNGTSWEDACKQYASDNFVTDNPAIGLTPKGLVDSTLSVNGLDDVIFAASIGDVCVTKLDEKYWVYTATSKIDKEYSEENKNALANALMGDWVDGIMDSNKDLIVENLTDDFLKVACETVAG